MFGRFRSCASFFSVFHLMCGIGQALKVSDFIVVCISVPVVDVVSFRDCAVVELPNISVEKLWGCSPC